MRPRQLAEPTRRPEFGSARWRMPPEWMELSHEHTSNVPPRPSAARKCGYRRAGFIAGTRVSPRVVRSTWRTGPHLAGPAGAKPGPGRRRTQLRWEALDTWI